MKRCCCTTHEGTNPLPISSFHKDTSNSDGLYRFCRKCSYRSQKKRFTNNPLGAAKYQMWRAAKHRAKKKNLPFSITTDDIIIPECCPILNIPLVRGVGKITDHSPSLDRIIPDLGYIPTNIIILSNRANMIKNCGTAQEHFKIYQFLTRQPSS